MSTPLRYEQTAKHIYNKLKQIPRTGWVMREVSNPETVYNHTVSLLKLADRLHSDLRLSSEDFDDLQHILEVHDWSEAVAGDEFIPNDNKQTYEARKEIKAERERLGLQELLEGKDYQDTVRTLFERYETASDPVAKLAKELDKYQALELALEYEELQGIPLFEEFYEYYKRDWPFSHPVILNQIDKLLHQHKQLLNTQSESSK